MEKTPASKACDEVFKERRKFIILGLTGRTGSGCTTTANILGKSFKEFSAPEPKSSTGFDSDEARKYFICHNFLESRWETFYHLKLSNILSGFILEKDFGEFENFCKDILQNQNFLFNNTFKAIFDNLKSMVPAVMPSASIDQTVAENVYDFYFRKVEEFAVELKDAIGHKGYSKVFQHVGNNIRNSEQPFISNSGYVGLYTIPRRANFIIKTLRKLKLPSTRDSVFVCLDAIRNPFEALFFKERYSSFYLLSVSVSDESRKSRLRQISQMNDDDIKLLDKMECPDKLKEETYFTSLSVDKCIELADVHIVNKQDNGGYSELKKQLVKYISLMLHPGLVTPSRSERCMQIAHDARLNSGCISRQVGAVVANSDYSVMAIGWNTTPQGQTPCSLRNVRHLISHSDAPAFSEYERSNIKFREVLKNAYLPIVGDGRPLCFCFKDAQNSIKSDKNQVHTRALHAEENAFLQVAKRGGDGLVNGVLFTTASPCELCSKKAYQLGIDKIYYIDPYPGIAEDQILKSGKKRPNLILFTGAVGRAFQQLYQSILPYKDEMELSFGLRYPPGETQSRLTEAENKIKSLTAELDKLRPK